MNGVWTSRKKKQKMQLEAHDNKCNYYKRENTVSHSFPWLIFSISSHPRLSPYFMNANKGQTLRSRVTAASSCLGNYFRNIESPAITVHHGWSYGFLHLISSNPVRFSFHVRELFTRIITHMTINIEQKLLLVPPTLFELVRHTLARTLALSGWESIH